MNMKKTIAAVAAGAVAVSAMATTVSALEAKTLTYNLVKTVKNQDAKGTVTATFTNVPLEADGTVIVEPVSAFGAHSWDTMVTISGSFWDDAAGSNKPITPVVATGMTWETGYSIEGSKLWNDEKSTVTIPVVRNGNGTNVALRASTNAVLTVTVKFPNLPDSASYVGEVNNLIKDGKLGIRITSMGSATNTGEKNSTVTYTNAGGAGKAVQIADQAKLNELSDLRLEYDAADYKWKVAVTGNGVSILSVTTANVGGIPVSDMDFIKSHSTITAPAGVASGKYVLKLGTDGNYYDSSFRAWTVATTNGLAFAGDIEVNYTDPGAAAADKTDTVNRALHFMNTVEDGDIIVVTKYEPAANGDGVRYKSDLSGSATEQSGNTEKKIPYRSTLTNSIYNTNVIGGSIGYDPTSGTSDGTRGSGDVIRWIGYANSDSKENETNNQALQIADAARSVINDAVQNYGDVVFTFNTATSNVYIEYNNDGTVKDYKYTSDAAYAKKLDGGVYKEIVNYTAFGRHFWDRDTGYDVNTVYINNDWLGNNLFEGALVINNNITLSLGATDKFDWTATSLSFSWDAIQDASLTQNQYANYIQNMVLRTSADWYWDNMTVTLGETETEEVDSGAPVEADDTDLPEDEVEEDLGDIEEEEEEEEPVEDVEPEPEPEPEPAPVETATNPGTGNASVALAVIPVALAAAAIVAKKRG